MTALRAQKELGFLKIWSLSYSAKKISSTTIFNIKTVFMDGNTRLGYFLSKELALQPNRL